MSTGQAKTVPATHNFQVDEIIHCIASRFPKNINQIYWFLHGDANWIWTKKSFSINMDTLVSLQELLRTRISPKQMEIIECLETIYQYKIHNRYRTIVGDKLWRKNMDISFQWFLTEARKCFKTVTLSSK